MGVQPTLQNQDYTIGRDVGVFLLVLVLLTVRVRSMDLQPKWVWASPRFLGATSPFCDILKTFWMRRDPVALWILPFLPESVPLKIVQQEEMLIPSWTFGSEPCQWQTSVDSLGHSTSGLWGVWARTGALTQKLRRCAKRRWISRGSLSIRRFFVLLSPDSFQGNLYTLESILFSFFPGGKSANGSQLEAPFGAASIQTPISTSCCHGRIADMKIPLNASTEVSFTGEASGSRPSELQMFIKFRKYEGFRLHSLFYPPI